MVKKIDLHIHTISVQGKDYPFEYSGKWLKKYVIEAKLDAIAITNHNYFSKENFLKVQEDLNECDVKIFPGMELDLEDGHVNIIFSEERIEELEKFSTWLTKYFDGNNKLKIQDYIKNLNCWKEAIYVFELKKSNSLAVPENLKEVTAVGGVSNQLKFQSVNKNDDDLIPVLFSDAHATNLDSEPTRNDISLLKNKNTYIQVDNANFEDIKNCFTSKKGVSISKDYVNDVFEINNHRVSTGLNLIVGKRGTGKTHFLEQIEKNFTDEDKFIIKQFETARADAYISEMRKSHRQKNFKRWVEKYTRQFSAIREYLSDEDFTTENDVDEYIQSVKKFALDNFESNSRSKYKLVKDQNFEKKPLTNLEKYIHSIIDLINSKDLWTYLTNGSEKKQLFIDTYNELRGIYISLSKEEALKTKVNEIIESVKEVNEFTTGISNLKSCNLLSIIKRNQIENKINEFIDSIIQEETLYVEEISGYKVIVEKSPFTSAKQFQTDISTKVAVNTDLISPYLQKNYVKFLNNLQTKSFYNPTNLEEYLVHLEVKLLDSYNTEASGGQAVGFALMSRLNQAKSKPLILVDEPEASLDNEYIRAELIPALRNLSKKSTVFVITHNSTLGTLLHPDYLIVTTKDENNDYKVLTGEFNSKKISSKEYSELSYDKFVEAMESGIEAYNKKGKIYEYLQN